MPAASLFPFCAQVSFLFKKGSCPISRLGKKGPKLALHFWFNWTSPLSRPDQSAGLLFISSAGQFSLWFLFFSFAHRANIGHLFFSFSSVYRLQNGLCWKWCTGLQQPFFFLLSKSHQIAFILIGFWISRYFIHNQSFKAINLCIFLFSPNPLSCLV